MKTFEVCFLKTHTHTQKCPKPNHVPAPLHPVAEAPLFRAGSKRGENARYVAVDFDLLGPISMMTATAALRRGENERAVFFRSFIPLPFFPRDMRTNKQKMICSAETDRRSKETARNGAAAQPWMSALTHASTGVWCDDYRRVNCTLPLSSLAPAPSSRPFRYFPYFGPH